VDHETRTAGGQPREAGQGLVEFALVAPILILLLMAIFQFAFVFQSQMGVRNAIREAARRAATAPAADEASLRTWTLSQLTGSTGLLESNVQGYAASRLGTGADAPSVLFCSYGTNQLVTVKVTYDHPEFFPLAQIAAFAAGHAAGPGWSWTWTDDAQMRLEQPFTTPPATTC
jgi:Flp pilus assembly protein TadG